MPVHGWILNPGSGIHNSSHSLIDKSPGTA